MTSVQTGRRAPATCHQPGSNGDAPVPAPLISVVVPTYNRLPRLERVLEALGTQTLEPSSFEIIVVSDGSTDDTDVYLAERAPIELVWARQPNGGPSAARNTGAQLARADLIVFIDDDIIATPDLVERHLQCHQEFGRGLVVIGPMLTPPDVQLSPWVQWEQAMLYKQYDAIRRGAFPTTFRQFYTGNASLERSLLEKVGGFDASMRRAEDVELGYRLATAGCTFRFEPAAIGYHHAERSFESWLRIAEDYGANDAALSGQAGKADMVALARREFRVRHPLTQLMALVCVGHTRTQMVCRTFFRNAATVASRHGFDRFSRAALSAIYGMAYYCSMADRLGGRRVFYRTIVRPAPVRTLKKLVATLAGHRRGLRDEPTTQVRTMTVPRVGFVLEQSLGHRTHADNLKRLLPLERSIDAEIMEIGWDVDGVAARVPVFNSNWTVRSSLRARRQIKRARRAGRLDALFIHTQVPAVLVADVMTSIPTVVSVDATPLQYDELGEHYGHAAGGRHVEQLKWRANQRVFERAAHIVSWSEWAKAGVVDGYGIDADKITVIPPGVVTSIWDRGGSPPSDGGPVRILFVGSDLERKGGTVLIEAFTRLRAELAADPAWRHLEVGLDLVTKSDVDPGPGITVHRDLAPNSTALVELFHRAAVFCLPTRGDCLPMVLSEAGAAGLPLVSTPVAAIPEIVRDGETGFLVGIDDVDALADRLATLVREPATRERLGTNARALVAAQYDAATNVARLAAILDDVATRDRSTSDRARVLLTVSGQVPDDLAGLVDRGERPASDYVALAKAMDADIVDVTEARRRAGRTGALVERLGGAAALLGWVCFRERSRYDAILTDGEQVGLPLALLCRLTGRRPFGHVMIVHILSVPKKAIPFRLLRLGSYIDTMVLYSSAQQRFVVDDLGFPADRTVLSSFAVDTAFFDPDRITPRANGRPVVSSAGLEFRDYPTLMAAAEGIDARFVLAAASPWSKRADSTEAAAIPDNVEVCRLGFADLRQLYADSDLVVVPLYDVAFQAGVTTILEAMAMGKTVVCSRARGQTDLIVDDVTGVYVPPGAPEPLRQTIEALLADPVRVKQIGVQARRYAEHVADVDVYANRLAAVVDAVGRRNAR